MHLILSVASIPVIGLFLFILVDVVIVLYGFSKSLYQRLLNPQVKSHSGIVRTAQKSRELVQAK